MARSNGGGAVGLAERRRSMARVNFFAYGHLNVLRSIRRRPGHSDLNQILAPGLILASAIAGDQRLEQAAMFGLDALAHNARRLALAFPVSALLDGGDRFMAAMLRPAPELVPLLVTGRSVSFPPPPPPPPPRLRV